MNKKGLCFDLTPPSRNKLNVYILGFHITILS